MGSEAIAIRAQVPNSCQIMLFSATFPPEVMATAHRIVPKPVTFRLARGGLFLTVLHVIACLVTRS